MEPPQVKEIPKGSEDFRRKNPHLFPESIPGVVEFGEWQFYKHLKPKNSNAKNQSRVAPVPATKPEQNEVHALGQGKKTPGRSRTCVVLRITLVRCGQRNLDSDNLAFCFKGLRDSISKTLKIDDADPRIDWVYGQLGAFKGHYGTIVKFDLLATSDSSRDCTHNE